MACYPGISPESRECAGCAGNIPAGITGSTDEINPPKAEPVCDTCLDGLDRPLALLLPCVRPYYQIQKNARDMAGLDS